MGTQCFKKKFDKKKNIRSSVQIIYKQYHNNFRRAPGGLPGYGTAYVYAYSVCINTYTKTTVRILNGVYKWMSMIFSHPLQITLSQVGGRRVQHKTRSLLTRQRIFESVLGLGWRRWRHGIQVLTVIILFMLRIGSYPNSCSLQAHVDRHIPLWIKIPVLGLIKF